MKSTLSRWGKRALWVLPAVLVFYVLVTALDLAYYRSHVPVRFRQARWEGRWETRRYFGLRGRLLVLMPDPIPDGVDFQAETLVYYPIYCAWRTGQFVKMDVNGRFNAGSPESGGRTTNEIPTGGGSLKFKGIVGNQTVEYAALLDERRTTIIGGYLSHDPDDYGHIELRRY